MAMILSAGDTTAGSAAPTGDRPDPGGRRAGLQSARWAAHPPIGPCFAGAGSEFTASRRSSSAFFLEDAITCAMIRTDFLQALNF